MRAIEMPGAEQGRRMRALRRRVIDSDIELWSRTFLDALTTAKQRKDAQ
jgi:trehalose 6-phosphate synthase